MTKQYNPNDALNQQANDFKLENFSPSSACTEPANDNATPEEIEGSHGDKTACIFNLCCKRILENIKEINFLDYLQKHIGCKEPSKYVTKGQQKIPRDIIAVIVADYVVKTIEQQGYKIAKYIDARDEDINEVYFYNGKYWQYVGAYPVIILLRDALEKMGYDYEIIRTAKISKILFDNFMVNLADKPNPMAKTAINLRNGTLEIVGAKPILRPHSANDFFLYCLDYDYDINATAPLFQSYLNQVLPDSESRQLLQEICGNIFNKTQVIAGMGVLSGTGHNGKGVFMALLNRIFGTENCGNYSLDNICQASKDGDAKRAALHGKLLNNCGETKISKSTDAQMLKTVTSGNDPIPARQYYGKPMIIPAVEFPKLIFAANSMLEAIEDSTGFYRRFKFVDFNVKIDTDKADPLLETKLAAELSGILNWVIAGLFRLLANGKFSECKRSTALLEQFKTDSNPLALFLQETGCNPSETAKQLFKQFYDRYRSFCHYYKFSPMYPTKLSPKIKEEGYKVERATGNVAYIYCDFDHDIDITRGF